MKEEAINKERCWNSLYWNLKGFYDKKRKEEVGKMKFWWFSVVEYSRKMEDKRFCYSRKDEKQDLLEKNRKELNSMG